MGHTLLLSKIQKSSHKLLQPKKPFKVGTNHEILPLNI